MDIIELIKEYQHWNPESGRFNANRTAKEYAAMLGISAPRLCRYYSGQRRAPASLVVAFLRVFPDAGFNALQDWMAIGNREVA